MDLFRLSNLEGCMNPVLWYGVEFPIDARVLIPMGCKLLSLSLYWELFRVLGFYLGPIFKF